jgi:hypothetical protein
MVRKLLTSKIVKSLFASLLVITSMGRISPASAYNQWVDCVVISSAGLSSFYSFGSPEYEIKISNGCEGDMGGVTLDFDSGSYDVWGFNNRVSIWSLTSWRTTKTFSLDNIKPGYYSPTLKITATKDYSTRRMNLPSFTIQAPTQPSLGNDGGTATLPGSSYPAKQICTSSTIAGKTCSDYPNWTYSICSTNPSGILQEKVGANWVKLWNFKGSKDSSCASKYPYLIDVEGSSKRTSGTVSLRLAFYKTSTKSAWYDNFKITFP